MEPIILASDSLQRQEYFRLMGLPFVVKPSRIEEICEGLSGPEELTGELARRKVKRVLETLGEESPPWICGADTVVSLGTNIFGKPKNRDEARNMLAALRGREHRVVTTVVLYNGRNGNMDCRAASGGVTFASLSDGEIEWYLDTGEWRGAAGAYKIQGLASCFIEEIRGSYSAIVGLPMRELYVMLRGNGYPYGNMTVL
jgi:septum formation protein